jgi:hypothetical protein
MLNIFRDGIFSEKSLFTPEKFSEKIRFAFLHKNLENPNVADLVIP